MKKFTASRLFNWNSLPLPQIIFEESLLIIDLHDGNKLLVNLIDIRAISFEKLWSGHYFIEIETRSIKHRVNGFTKNEVMEINMLVNNYQLTTIKDWGNWKSTLKILKNLTSMLEDINEANGFEPSLAASVVDKLNEGLSNLKRLEVEGALCE